MVAYDHHGYRDSVRIAKLPVPKWHVGYRTSLAATLSVFMCEGSSEPPPQGLSYSEESLKLPPYDLPAPGDE